MNKKNDVLSLFLLLSLLFSSTTIFASEDDSAAQRSESTIESPEYGKRYGVFGDLTLGPSMSLFSVPHPLYIGLEGKYANVFGFQVGEGFIPDLMFQDATINIQALSGGLKWFPFQGAFFIGMQFGTQKITAKKSSTIATVKVDATMEVTSSFYKPHAGWRWVWDTGFFMGLDFGWQIASGAETDFRSNLRNPLLLATPEYGQLETDVTKVGNDLGNKALPSITLIHFGWLF